MDETFFGQRADIREGVATSMMRERWPYLFEVKWYIRHFNLLTGINICEQLTSNINSKAGKIFEHSRSILSQATSSKKKVHPLKEVEYLLTGEDLQCVPPHSLLAVLMAIMEEPINGLILMDPDVSY